MSTPKTYPSPSFVELRTASPPSLNLEFTYNFYVPDERIDNSGLFQGMPKSDNDYLIKNGGMQIAQGSAVLVDNTLSSPTGDLQRFVPRYIKVSLSDPLFEESYVHHTAGGLDLNTVNKLGVGTDPLFEESKNDGIYFGGNPTNSFASPISLGLIKTQFLVNQDICGQPLKILKPEEINTPMVGTQTTQDTELSERLAGLTAFSLKLRQLDSTAKSVPELATILDKTTPPTVNKNILAGSLSSLATNSTKVINANKEEEKNTFLSRQTATSFKVSTNQKFSLAMNRTERLNVLSPHVVPSLEQVALCQNISNQFTAADSTGISLADYDIKVADYRTSHPDSLPVGIGLTNITLPDDLNTSSTLYDALRPRGPEKIGYIVEKTEIRPDGHRTKLDDHTVRLGIGERTFFDYKVKYGHTYEYVIMTVSAIEIRSMQKTSYGPYGQSMTQVMSSVCLVKSDPSVAYTVTCEELVAPPPPSVVKLNYLPGVQKIRVSWDMPTNPQRDIKYFQIFKRKSLAHPYTLIKMYDFDKTVEGLGPREYVEPFLTEKVPMAKKFYDDDMERGGVCYYAVASVDAHGLSSGYSTQFKVRYDELKNDIKVTTVSREGAPKAYPNFYLRKTTGQTYRYLEDVMKDSNHSSMNIYFDPESINVIGINGDNVKLLSKFVDTERMNQTAKEILFPTKHTGTVFKTVPDPKKNFYKFSIINVDRQIQKTLTVGINDVRTIKSDSDETVLQTASSNEGGMYNPKHDTLNQTLVK